MRAVQLIGPEPALWGSIACLVFPYCAFWDKLLNLDFFVSKIGIYTREHPRVTEAVKKDGVG